MNLFRQSIVSAFFGAFCALNAFAATPTLYFTDLVSGPVGSIVTVYGTNLQPSVTVNNANAVLIASSPTKVSFVVPATTSGSILVGNSNSLPFTVRAGNIYYVATNGSDSQSGVQNTPWATIPHAFNAAQCGDVIYVMNGVNQTGLDNYGASLSVQRRCTESMPLALVGYPGATVTIGSTNGLEYGIRNPDINGDGYDGMVFANLVIRANNTGVKDVSNQYWRMVGNDFSCPNGGGQAACVMLEYSSNFKFFGNSIHDTGAGGTKYYHSFYATTNSNHVEVGWNHIYNNNSCRGIQFYSTGGSPQYDLVVHDNIISGQLCDGINFSTIDATLGPIEAYNNLVYHVGLGGANLNTPNEACIASLGYGSPGGEAVIFGNTFADCGSAGGSTAGAITVQTGSPTFVSTNNLVIQNAGEPIYSPNSNTSLITHSHDVLLTTGVSGVVNAQYQPIAGSPALGAGTALGGMLYDLAGNSRPQSGSSDAGAYLYSSGTGTDPSGPAVSLSVASLTFGNEPVNLQAAPKTVTLTNTGGTTLTITSIVLGGTNATSFFTSSTCGTSLAPGAACTIQAAFSPIVTGSLTANIKVTDNATPTTQNITLTGTGTAASTTPTAVLSATSLSFGSATVNASTAAQNVTLTNSGNGPLTIKSYTLGGANASSFLVSNNCGTSLAAGASCMIQAQFKPLSAGNLTAGITLTDNAASATQTVLLTGVGTAASTGSQLSLSATSLTFGDEKMKTQSASKVVTVANTGKSTLTITSILRTGTYSTSFVVWSSCGPSLAAGASCTIHAAFQPWYTSGPLSASITLTDSAPNSPQTIALTGTGVK